MFYIYSKNATTGYDPTEGDTTIDSFGYDVLHDPTDAPGIRQRLLISPILKMAIGTQGSLTFGIYPDHPMYGKLHNRSTYVFVADDDGEIWRGRIISQSKGFDNIVNIYAEGELAYFQDTYMRPFVFKGTRENFLSMIIDNHNDQLTSSLNPSANTFRKFELSYSDPDRATDMVDIATSNAMSTWSLISEHIISKGIYPRLYTAGSDRIIRFSDEFSGSNQLIEFASNLIDLNHTKDATNVITALIPYGPTLNPGDTGYEEQPTTNGTWNGNRMTVTVEKPDTPLGMIRSSNTVRVVYGDIVGTKIYEDNITDNMGLYRAAVADLHKIESEAISITARAVDLRGLDSNGKDRLLPGYEYTVTSPPQDIEAKLVCTSVEIHITDQNNSVYNFGVGPKALTSLVG